MSGQPAGSEQAHATEVEQAFSFSTCTLALQSKAEQQVHKLHERTYQPLL